MTELEQLCENALYDEMRVLEDGKSVVRDIPTGKLYFKKTLDVYNEQVFAYLRDHKNRHVAAVQTYWKEGDKLVVIEELIQGRTLDEMLKADETAGGLQKGDAASGDPHEADGTAGVPHEADGTTAVPLTFAERVDILAQICDGLEFLHSANPSIIHRDIKASNIMVTDDFVVKIIDYDAAKIYVTGQTKDTMMIGTQGLAAPEQYGFAQSDVRTDLYALGKLVERMLPGNVDAKRITDKATEMDPKKRYASAAQMKAHIQRIREKTSALDRKFEKIPGFDPMNKSHRIRARLLLAASLVAVAAFGAFLWWRLLVYPVEQAAQISAEIAVINGLENKEENIPNAVQAFVTAHPYRKMNAAQKKAVRDGMADAVCKCYVDEKTGNAQKIRDILIENYGDKTIWETVYSYGKTANELTRKKFDDALTELKKFREEGAVDAEEHWEDGVRRTQEAARTCMEKYKETKSITELQAVMEAHTALIKFEVETEEDFDAIYREILEIAVQRRKEENWEAAVNIYKAVQESGLGDPDELTELINEAGYEEAETAFSRKDYNKAESLYEKLGDYKDSAEKHKESLYLQGNKEYGNGKYNLASTYFEKIPGYKDADERALEAKYRYCEETLEDPTHTTYQYIQYLVDIGYEGAEEMQEEVYKWHTSIKTGMVYSFGSMQSAYLEVRLTGGQPDATTTLTFRIDDPTRGEHDTYCDEKEYKAGETVRVNYSEEDSSYSLFDRTYKVSVYADGGELIGTWEGQFSTEF